MVMFGNKNLRLSQDLAIINNEFITKDKAKQLVKRLESIIGCVYSEWQGIQVEKKDKTLLISVYDRNGEIKHESNYSLVHTDEKTILNNFITGRLDLILFAFIEHYTE